MTITIETLRAAGLSDAEILRVIEIEQAERLKNTREANRLRQQRYRARVTDVTRDQRDQRDKRDGHIDTSSLDTQNKKVRKVSISPDWKPTDADRDYAKAKGWSDSRIDTEAERFHNHYLANGEARKSWRASWCKWVISPFQNGNGGLGNGRTVQARDERHSISATFDKIFEKLASGDGASVVPFEANPRLLQNRRRE